ncbi:MAG: leucine-rich repeat domain-containing protein [Clostridia bacterium]|nr:leucine-rich repeat domain-containing protein [Clostridia bacterium]
MKREKNYKTARLIEALEYIDVRFIEEAAEKIKPRPTGQAFYGKPSRSKALRQFLALAACVLLLSAAIPAITYLANHLPDIVAFFIGDETTGTDPELTHPETPPTETSRAPETTVNTDPETTAPLYDGTTAESEPEHNGSYGLEYKMNEDGKSAMLFHRGICTDENVIVASVWNGVPVTIIGEVAFADYIKYKTITIPESVTAIDMRAFKNCTGLESVVLHDGISYIGADAFENCVALTEITLPKSLEWIQTGLFMNCINLQKVIIGNEVEKIVFGAFYDCSALRELHYLGTKAEWNAIQKDETWNTKSAITVVHCSDGDVEITPYNADEPEYDGSRGLEYRIEGDHAVLVGIGTCTDKDIVTATTYNGLPVTGIDGLGLSGYKGITSVTISEGVTHIEMCAFSGCPDLRAVYLPSTLQFLSAGEGIAFENCDNIDTIKVADSNPKYYSVGNCLIERGTGNLVLACSKSVLPSDGSIKSIGQFAFGGSDSLEKIVIPEGVTVINPYAFAGCASLKSVTFPDSLTTVRWDAFANCTSLESVKLGDNVTEIGSRVFSGCSSLVDITLPGRVDSFGEEIFAGCPIESIVIPDGVKTLHGGMFANCRKLKSVTLPDEIETIVGFAFAYCSSLQKITLPRSVTKIQGEVFADCSNLTEFTFKGTKAEWDAIEKQDGWNDGCPFTVIHCSDGDVLAEPMSYDEATELARQYWSPIESGYFVCYASYEMYLLVRPDEVIVDRIYIDRYTGEISMPKLTYPDIPDPLLKVLLNETTYIRQFDSGSEGYFKDTILDYPTAETGSFGYAVCDLDGDGQEELILSSLQYEIVLREFEGKVYGYLFNFRSLLDLKTDGSFNFTSNAGMTYGTARLSFDGTKYVFTELTRRELVDNGSISYFVDDKKVTKEEFDAREELLSQEEAPYEHLAIYPLRAWFPGG